MEIVEMTGRPEDFEGADDEEQHSEWWWCVCEGQIRCPEGPVSEPFTLATDD